VPLDNPLHHLGITPGRSMSDGDAIDLLSLLALCAPHGGRERQTSDEISPLHRTPPLGRFRGETKRITISYTRTPYLFLRNSLVWCQVRAALGMFL
jgi:hypothetical protein